ncbi:hypothetical protein C1T31_12955 [Hanstruepera neustonica]|uniref:Uncharacterized protein n=1 Tax=Hanstruepera neustonica TaxID=1445657 RepID=A0A2K1DW12_9FLAO|nr:hypothetical protein [Hanstruepera neustonica]PNQ72228.1 hypothetical protein C1T31_12955 [Hanstruepera neustonica]
MKTLLKLTVIVICLSFYGCKNEKSTATFTDYKYTDTENVLNCTDVDTKLYNEALLSFEEDIIKAFNPRNNDPRVAYSTFFRSLLGNRVDFQSVASPHTMKVFEALKGQSNLWNSDNTINYKAPIFKCLSSNFKNQSLATTFNALVETNSMRLDLIGAPLQKEIKNANSDRYLSMYIALDMYYANLFKVDPTKVTEKPAIEETTLQTTPSKPTMQQKPADDPHAGHNHD